MTHRVSKKQPTTTTQPAPIVHESSVPVSTEISENDLSEALSSASDDSVLANKEAWLFRWGIFGSICLVGITLVVVTYRLTLPRWESGSGISEVITPALTASISPTSFQVPFERSAIRVQVINASGVAGRARKVLDALMKRGYRDGGVETALVSDQTAVYISDDIKTNSADIEKDISEDAGITADLSALDGTSHTVKIILGTK